MGIFNQKVKLHAPTRNWFDLSHSSTISTDMGAMTPTMSKLFPAGAKLKGSIEHIVRMNPMDAPVFQRFEMYHDVFAYPLHLVWKDSYQYFRGGNNGNTDYPFPTLHYKNVARFVFALRFYELYYQYNKTDYATKPNLLQGSLLDFLGYPTFDYAIQAYVDNLQAGTTFGITQLNYVFNNILAGEHTPSDNTDVSILPVLCYQGIYREYYRDQFVDKYDPYDTPNLDMSTIGWKYYVPECDVWDFLGNLDTYLDGTVYAWSDVQTCAQLFAAAKLNPDTNKEISQLMQLFSTRNVCFSRDYFTAACPNSQLGSAVQIPFTGTLGGSTVLTGAATVTNTGGSNVLVPMWSGTVGSYNNNAVVNANTIPDLRKANRLQEFLEKSALGNRIYDFFKIHFGVESSDARLQIPHLIARLRSTFSISEVTQTSQTTIGSSTGDSALGSFAGHGVNVNKDFAMNYTFEEPTYVMVITSIRPKQAYFQGIKRELITTDRFDHIIPEFAEIGMQPIYKRELFWSDTDEIFGYIDRYGDSKQMTDEIHGDFRGSLLYWHDSRAFSTGVNGLHNSANLNSDFLHIQPREQGLNRIFAYEDVDFNHFYMLMQFNLSCELPLPYYPNYRM